MALVDKDHNVYLKSKLFQLDEDNKLCLEKVANFFSQVFENTQYTYEIKNYKEIETKQIIDGHLHFGKEKSLYSIIGCIQIVNNEENKDWICYTLTLFNSEDDDEDGFQNLPDSDEIKRDYWHIQQLLMDKWSEIFVDQQKVA